MWSRAFTGRNCLFLAADLVGSGIRGAVNFLFKINRLATAVVGRFGALVFAAGVFGGLCFQVST